MQTRLTVFGLLVAFCYSSYVLADTDWKLENDSEGIQVFSREIVNSPVIAVRGEGKLDATVLEVTSIILDHEHAPEWVDSLVESKRLKEVSDHEFINSNRLGMPIFVKDRDMILQVSVSKNPADSSILIQSQSIHDPAYPENPSLVRGEVYEGSFLLKPIENGTQTFLVGIVRADPKGSLPKFFVNFFQKKWPRNTFNGIRKQLQTRRGYRPPEYKELFEKLFKT